MQNLKENKVLIIDPVGCKAGMDYYDNSLVTGFSEVGVCAEIASNYINQVYHSKSFFRSKRLKGKLAKLLDWLVGFWNSFLYARKRHFKHVILHSFSSEVKDLYPYLLAKLFSIRITTIVHDVSGFANGDASFVRKLIYKYSFKLVVHNLYSKELLFGFLHEPLRGKVHVIPHGHFLSLPESHISKQDARNLLGIPKEEKMILFFGQIKKQKGLDLLIKALSQTDACIKLTIAGKPWKDSFDNYQSIIDELDLSKRVRLHIRYIEDAERDLFFKAADLVIIPYYEIYQSGVLLMAMSYGVPVLASNLRPNAEIINHLENGLLFESGSIHDLAESINYFF